jgi:hypothetical protein
MDRLSLGIRPSSISYPNLVTTLKGSRLRSAISKKWSVIAISWAAYLAAGLDGIEEGRDPGEPNHENLYELTPMVIRKRAMKNPPSNVA